MKYDKFLEFMNLLVMRPFKVAATINALASIMVALLYIFGPKTVLSGGRLYQYLTTSSALYVWVSLMLVSAVLTLVAFHYRHRRLAGWAASGLCIAWIYAVAITVSYGNWIFSVPFLMFPFLLSCYVKLKINLDSLWYER